MDPSHDIKDCPRCNGNGSLFKELSGEGERKYTEDPCQLCGGEGYVWIEDE